MTQLMINVTDVFRKSKYGVSGIFDDGSTVTVEMNEQLGIFFATVQKETRQKTYLVMSQLPLKLLDRGDLLVLDVEECDASQ